MELFGCDPHQESSHVEKLFWTAVSVNSTEIAGPA